MATSKESSRALPGAGIALALLLIASGAVAWLMWPEGAADDGRSGYGRIVADAENARALAAERLAGNSGSSEDLTAMAADVRRQWQSLTGSAGRHRSRDSGGP